MVLQRTVSLMTPGAAMWCWAASAVAMEEAAL
jgi:hypothetical protein